jgi:hypothetical protein
MYAVRAGKKRRSGAVKVEAKVEEKMDKTMKGSIRNG